MTDLRAASDTTPADWIVSGLRGFAESVLSLVPEAFDAYVRVFHPAYRRVGAEWEPVRWAEIAAANGTRAHAGMQLCALTGSYRFENDPQPGVFDLPPDEGSLPAELTARLASALSAHTTTPDECWFAVWNGFGAMRDDVRSAPTFAVPFREYHLLGGPLRAAAESVEGRPWTQSPNLWWPEDRAWCVATEIDLKTTFIGCGAACRDTILALPDAEALPIDPSIGITWRSDVLNPFE